jgi:predicted transcriptional regulator
MSTVTVRIRKETHRSLKQLADKTGEPMPEILTKAIEEYRRTHFLDGLAKDFARLQGDSSEWKEELSERDAWDATLGDDLDED